MTKPLKTATLYKNDYLLEDVQSDDLKIRAYKYSETHYDEQGNVVMEVKYTENGEVSEKTVNRFDEKNQLIEEIYYLDEEEIAERKTFEKDDSGKIIRAFKHYLDDSKDTMEYHYNDNNQLIEILGFDVDGDLERKEVFSYQDNYIAGRKAFDEENELVLEKIYTYTDNGNSVDTAEWDEMTGEKRRTVEKFDKNGIILETLRYDQEDQLIDRVFFTADDSGKIVSWIEESEQQGKSNTTVTYDEKGNDVLQEEQNESGEIITKVERKFDSDNRVVESKVFIDGQGKHMSQKYFISYEYTFHE